MSISMPSVDPAIVARRGEIVAALRGIVPGEGVIDDEDCLRPYESDGLTAYRQGFDRPKAVAGRQDERLGGSELWVVPNPSGLNAHATVADLAQAYAEPAGAAGIELAPPPA